MSKTLFITHTDCLKHDMGPSHLESPARLRAITSRLAHTGLLATLELAEAPLALDETPILNTHTAELWSSILLCSPERGTRALSAEAIMSPGTLDAIRRGVGGALLGVERVMSGANPNAFIAVRPPGHHATRGEAMGFCFLNNAAIAAKHALSMGLERVAVVDIDVHHGNGTEDIAAADPRIYMASTFGLGIYPGNGSRPMGENMTNVGLDGGTSGAQMRSIALDTILPDLDAFAPQLVIVSAGYDAHRDDPLGNQSWSESDYHWWFEQLQALANKHAQGKLVAILEGGYNVEALALSVEQSILAMQNTASCLARAPQA
jgi:acetoin utilization deacetylase AcuC-like enzyme